ncbi:unnamed protein product [Brassica oleracea]
MLSQISDKLRSIAKLTCLSEKTSREIFSGIFEKLQIQKNDQNGKLPKDVFHRRLLKKSSM